MQNCTGDVILSLIHHHSQRFEEICEIFEVLEGHISVTKGHRDLGRVRCLPDDKDSSSSGLKMPFDVARTTKILRDVT